MISAREYPSLFLGCLLTFNRLDLKNGTISHSDSGLDYGLVLFF